VPSNVEIKARARDLARQAALAEELGDGPAVELLQEDTFFPVPRGRLKLRVLAPDRGELIHYERPDAGGPRTSRYRIAATADPHALRETLAATLGTCGVVRKRRRLVMAGQTRIHLDEVEGLGDFLELEVVLRPGQDRAEGAAIARRLMRALEIRESDLVATAYVDLLRERGMAGNE
jgi:predicted adenylyl cyclase CyaB